MKFSVPSWALLLAMLSYGTRSAAQPQGRSYTVCVVIESGFTMLHDGQVATPEEVRSDAQLRGFDVDSRRLALAGLNYTVRVLSSYGEVEVRTRNGECDVGWAQFFQLSSRKLCAPDPVTCRELDDAAVADAMDEGSPESWTPYRCCARYGPNVFPFEINAMYVARDHRVDFFGSFFAMVESAFFVNFMCFSFLLGCIFSHIVWFAERHPNTEQFPVGYLDGIDDSFWWAAATFSTVGYGDKAPITPAGRLFSVIWMIIGVTLCSILSGHMATSFYAQQNAEAEFEISTVNDLAGRRVCGYSATFRSWYLPSSVPYTAVIRDNVAECGALMQAGAVDVTVMEAPMMNYWMRTDPWAMSVSLELSPALAAVPMGVVYSASSQSELGPLLDYKLLELSETAAWRDMQSRWFGQTIEDSDDGQEQVDWRLLAPSLALLGVYILGVLNQSRVRRENPCFTCHQGVAASKGVAASANANA